MLQQELKGNVPFNPVPFNPFFALEAIGPYAAALVTALRTHGFEVGVVNPRRIKAFRDAEGRRAKTDKLDATLMARSCETECPA